jgi:hypothetical protein
VEHQGLSDPLDHQELLGCQELLEHLDHLVQMASDLSLQDLGILIRIIIKTMLFITRVAVMFLYRVFLVMVQYY